MNRIEEIYPTECFRNIQQKIPYVVVHKSQSKGS